VRPSEALHVQRVCFYMLTLFCSDSFQVKGAELAVLPDQSEQQCPAVKGYYCVFHALLLFYLVTSLM